MNIQQFVFAGILMATALPSSAGIVLPNEVHNTPSLVAHSRPAGAVMPTLIMVPTTVSPRLEYPMQRARSWSDHRRGSNAIMFAPAVVPLSALTGDGAFSYEQFIARTNLSRASAFRHRK